MAEPFADNPEVVANRWRPLTDAEAAVAQTLLIDAAQILLTHVPSIPARYAAGTLDLLTVERVQAAMVKRVLANPEAMRSETIGQYSYTRDQALSAGLLYATEGELTELRPAAGRLRVGTVRLGSAWPNP